MSPGNGDPLQEGREAAVANRRPHLRVGHAGSHPDEQRRGWIRLQHEPGLRLADGVRANQHAGEPVVGVDLDREPRDGVDELDQEREPVGPRRTAPDERASVQCSQLVQAHRAARIRGAGPGTGAGLPCPDTCRRPGDPRFADRSSRRRAAQPRPTPRADAHVGLRAQDGEHRGLHACGRRAPCSEIHRGRPTKDRRRPRQAALLGCRGHGWCPRFRLTAALDRNRRTMVALPC